MKKKHSKEREREKKKEYGLWSQTAWARILIQSLSFCVILGKFLNLSTI